MTDPMPDNKAPDPSDDYQGEERRDGPRDRRAKHKDRREPDRVAEDIAPRRHPDIKGRREYDD